MKAWQLRSLRPHWPRPPTFPRSQKPFFCRSSSSTSQQRASERSGTLPLVGTAVATAVVTLLASKAWDGIAAPTEAETAKTQSGGKYADLPTMLKAVNELKRLLGDEFVSVDAEDIENHGYSDWSTSNTTERPVAVVSPATTEQVSQIARVCSKYRVPMVPFGAGSSVEGNFSAPHSGICIDLSRMNQVVAVYEQDMNVTVQAGVRWVDLNDQLKSTGLFLPMDPSPTAYVGGMIATNCSGTNAMRYGTMKDWVVNLTVVLPDGSVIKTKRRPRKSSAGYNLNALFTGSEGTLGIITEATLKLAVIPQETSVGIATFPTVGDATAAASKLIRAAVPLAALEFMDDVQMRIINQNGGAGGRYWAEAPTLFLKFTGTTSRINESIDRTREILKNNKGDDLVFASTPEEGDNLWSARKQALWTTLAARPQGTEIWSTDVAVPISRLAEIVEMSKEESSSLGLFSTVLGHVGDGNFHQAVMYNPKSSEQYRAVKACVSRMMRRALEMEGTISGEHGIGIGKKDYLEEELGKPTVDLMRTLKQSVDPYWLMNPGKLLGLSALAAASASATTTSGKFTALCFNVAGLPEILNSNDVNGTKTENAEELGKYFAEYGYDIIQMQEDFNYHAYIYEYDDHPYRTATSGGAAIGSGLNTISNYDWVDFTRVKWDTCSDASESDCLTPKGFTFMRWNPSEGVYIDFYNLHADAGTEDGDETARNANLQQVADYIDTWSTGNAVVIMGDTNSRYTRSADTGIRVFKSQNSLTDVWVELEMGGVYPTAGADSLMCDNPSTNETCETVDKVLYRGSSIVTLAADSFRYDGEEFLNTNPEYLGDVLSDHNPVLVDFSWTLSSSLRQSEFSGGPHGDWFNDLPSLPASPVASVLTFRGANRLDAVALELTDGTSFSHGGTGGTAVSLTLGTGEYWTQAELCTGQYNSHTRNFYIKATTSAGNVLEAGTATSNCTTFTADEGYAIVGYMGQDGDEIDQLAFIYAAY